MAEPINCKHPSVVVMPGKVWLDKDKVKITDLEKGQMYCRICEEELPIEDLQFYQSKNVSVGIPVDTLKEGVSDGRTRQN